MHEDTAELQSEISFPCRDCESGVRILEEALARNTALFRAMQSHSRDGVLLTGPDGRIVHVVRSILGHEADGLPGTSVEDMVHPEDRHLIRDCYRRLLDRACDSVEIEARAFRGDGSYVWVEATVTDMLDAPEVQAIVCNYRDITGRKEQELIMAEFEAIVQSSELAIFSRDMGGRIVTWNKGAQRTFGYGAAEAIGQEISMLVPEDRREEELAARQRVIQTKAAVELRTERLHKDGSRITAAVQMAPVLDRLGGVRGIAHISRPIR
jgi:PAS domain S-box-containing protein